MKKTKKIVALVLAAVMLVCTTVAATVAYLTSTDSVTNTFTVGKVKITLDEADVDDSDNDQNTTERDKANTYKIFPGGTYDKDPIVHVVNEADVEDCYVFVKVVNGLGASEAAVDGLGKIEDQMLARGWAKVEGVENVWIYKGTGSETKVAVSKGTDLPVFVKFAVSDALGNDELSALNAKTIVINAYAVQVDGFEADTPADIWTAAAFS